MPEPITALIAAGSTLIGGAMQSSAARSAARTQAGAAEAGIEEQRRQFDRMSEILAPYVALGPSGVEGLAPFRQAGATAFERQQALLGLRGPEAEAAELAAIQRRPGFTEQQRLGEEAILRRGAVTGGLRGGNVQRALAQFSPALLAREVESQYGRLGGLASAAMGIEERLATLGQASATRQAASAGNLGTNVATLLGERGAALAGGQLGAARAYQPFLQLPGQLLGYQAATGRSLFGQTPITRQEYAPIVPGGPEILPAPTINPSTESGVTVEAPLPRGYSIGTGENASTFPTFGAQTAF